MPARPPKKRPRAPETSEERENKQAKKDDSGASEDYEVEKILDMKTTKKGEKQYLVKWKGFDPSYNTWEQEANLNCSDIVEEFLEILKRKEGAATPKRKGKSLAEKKPIEDSPVSRSGRVSVKTKQFNIPKASPKKKGKKKRLSLKNKKKKVKAKKRRKIESDKVTDIAGKPEDLTLTKYTEANVTDEDYFAMLEAAEKKKMEKLAEEKKAREQAKAALEERRKVNAEERKRKMEEARAKREAERALRADDPQKEQEFEVQKLLDVHKHLDGGRSFLVKWAGFSSSHNTWEREEDLNCPVLVAKFDKAVEKAVELGERGLRDREALDFRKRVPVARVTFDSGRKGLRQEARRMTYYDMDED